MFKNYLKVAYRNFASNKAFSLINVFGLAVGLTTCLLIMLYIVDESSYDQQHKDKERFFRIASISNKAEEYWAACPAPMAEALKEEVPEVQQVTRLLNLSYFDKMLLKYKHDSISRQFFETNGYYVDSNFFQLFTYHFKYGNAATALLEPNSLVVSETLANKFFGNEDPVGRSMKVTTPYGEMDYTVKGVFHDATGKSHIPAHYFLSMRNNDMWNWVQQQTGWLYNNIFYTYVKLKEGTNPKLFEQKLNRFLTLHAGADMKAAGFSKSLYLQPVKDIYLHSSISGEIAPNGNIIYLYILGSIAAFILLIACINFMNLSTARSQKRAKEVGVRKVMGAEKMALICQFLGESFLMCLIALTLSFFLMWILLPLFNSLTQKNLQLFDQPGLIGWVAGLTVLTGLLAGLYPAMYLSAFKPASVLKGKALNSFSATAIRKGLVVFQFTVSICLVLAAIVIWQQLNLLENHNPGFRKDQQIILPLKQTANNNEQGYTMLKNALLESPGIKGVTSGSTYPGIANLNDVMFYAEGKKPNDAVDIQLSTVENDYLRNLGMTILTGRAFSKEFQADSSAIILNQKAVKNLGYTVDAAVGREVQFDFSEKHYRMHIVAVVKDFNFESLHNEIKPFGFTTEMFGATYLKYAYVIASVNTNNYSGVLKAMEKSWTKLNPETPFQYSFLDQDFQRNYDKEQLTSRIVVYFTVIAILIACLGLFGLAAFSAEQRTREIGIRKVLGASVTSIMSLLSKDFIKLVVIAIIIASPLAGYIMNQWLSNFAYRINISWWMFGIAGCLALFIALITVSVQAVKAALGNPAKSLRAE